MAIKQPTVHYRYYFNLLSVLPYVVLTRLTHRTCREYWIVEPFVAGKCGLEIGGPSTIFLKHHLIPIYDRCQRIDNCDFSQRNIWNEQFDRHIPGWNPGAEYVAEARELSCIPDETYDFVLASHVLEHVANPLSALQEWKRVLRPGGVMLVVVPDKLRTFDHNRPLTPFHHIEADFQGKTTEDDMTHLEEILALHDLHLDPQAGSISEFRARCLQNPALRGMHHHVFSPEVLGLAFERLDLRVLSITLEQPWHILGLAQKWTSEVGETEPWR